jgi:hypothetical protein
MDLRSFQNAGGQAVKFSIFFILSILLAVGLAPVVYTQIGEDQRFINTLPSKLPYKIEIINGDFGSAVHDVEIRITNIGKRPIYYLALNLASQDEFMTDNRVGLRGYVFGDSKLSYFYYSGTRDLSYERQLATPFEPGETKIFRVTRIHADGFLRVMEEKGISKPGKIVLEHVTTNFGDGTGFGTRDAIEMPEKKINRK